MQRSWLIFIYLFSQSVRFERAARDGSLTARATGRLSHILFSLLAVLSPSLPCHITAATLLPLHPYLSPFTSNQHTHFPSLPSFGFILRLLVTQRTVFTHPTLLHFRHPPPSPGTLTKHTPRDSNLPEFQFRHEAISSRIGQFSLYNRPRLAYTGNMPDCRHSIQTNLTASDKLGHRFFCFPLWDGRGKEKVQPRPRRRSCIVVLNTFIVPAHPRDLVPLDVLRYDTCKLNTCHRYELLAVSAMGRQRRVRRHCSIIGLPRASQTTSIPHQIHKRFPHVSTPHPHFARKQPCQNFSS
jgi:hypothetical protein